MAKLVSWPNPDELLSRLDERGPVIRYADLVEEDTLTARRSLDKLVLAGDVARFPVGEHLMVRDLRGDPDRSKPWPHDTPAESVSP